jgi:hypothetical protein
MMMLMLSMLVGVRVVRVDPGFEVLVEQLGRADGYGGRLDG